MLRSLKAKLREKSEESQKLSMSVVEFKNELNRTRLLYDNGNIECEKFELLKDSQESDVHKAQNLLKTLKLEIERLRVDIDIIEDRILRSENTREQEHSIINNLELNNDSNDSDELSNEYIFTV